MRLHLWFLGRVGSPCGGIRTPNFYAHLFTPGAKHPMLRSRLAIVRPPPRSAIVSPHRSLAYSRGLVRRGESGDTRGDALMTPEARAVQRTRAAERRRFGMPVIKILASGVVGMGAFAWWYAQNRPRKGWTEADAYADELRSLQAHHIVQDQRDIECLLSQVRLVLGRHGLGLGKVPLRVRLLREDEIHSLDVRGRVEGTTHRVLRPSTCEHLSGTLRGVESVGLKPGLTAVHAAQVLAHEYAHCWLWLQGFPALDARLEEGLCELVAYLFLLSCLHTPPGEGAPLIHDEMALRRQILTMEANAHPEYATGFRECVEALRGRALHELLGYVREHGRLPQPLRGLDADAGAMAPSKWSAGAAVADE